MTTMGREADAARGQDLAEPRTGRFGASDKDKRTSALGRRRWQVADPKPTFRPMPCTRFERPPPNGAKFGVRDPAAQVLEAVS
jgi:hypothetical protein